MASSVPRDMCVFSDTELERCTKSSLSTVMFSVYPETSTERMPGYLMSLSCLGSQGCHLILRSCIFSLLFCLALLLFLSCNFSANGSFS